jgi:hypothetical protein
MADDEDFQHGGGGLQMQALFLPRGSRARLHPLR